MVFLISPKSGKYIHIYFKPNSILSLSEESAFFICPPWGACALHVMNLCPVAFIHTPGPCLLENCSADHPLLGKFALCRFDFSLMVFFYFCEMTFLYFRALILENLTYFGQKLRILELGNIREKKKWKAPKIYRCKYAKSCNYKNTLHTLDYTLTPWNGWLSKREIIIAAIYWAFIPR